MSPADVRLAAPRTVRGLENRSKDYPERLLIHRVAAVVVSSPEICYVWMNLGQGFDEAALLDVLTTIWSRAAGVGQPPFKPRRPTSPPGARVRRPRTGRHL